MNDVLSFGGGRQTTAILILMATGRLPMVDLIIMADTGRERQKTWDYISAYSKPLMDKLGIPFVIAPHNLSTVDLYAKNDDLLIPAFLTNEGKLPIFCSSEWKKYPVRRKLRELGFTKVKMWYGMSLDEVHRMKISDKKWIENYYPLIFDLRMNTHSCISTITDYGFPQPPISSCWMCPHIRDDGWLDMQENQPDDFEKALI